MPMPELHEEDSPLALEVTKDHFDMLARGANLLLIGHGAGLVGCVSLLKEHISLYGGVGLYAVIFGVGLMLASFGYSLVTLARMNAMSLLAGSQLMRPRWASLSYHAALFGLGISLLQLYAAIWGILFSGLLQAVSTG